MKYAFIFAFILVALAFGSTPPRSIITTSSDISQSITKSNTTKTIGVYENTAILEVKGSYEEELHEAAHKRNVCGGYFVHDTVTDAKKAITDSQKETKSISLRLNKDERIHSIIKKVQPKKVESFIRELSDFKNRYYKSEQGVKAAKRIKDEWSKYTATELYNHKDWPQPSVIATFTGTKYPDEIIVVGGHLDSISGWFRRETSRAPGADDNASGISTITEAIRILSEAKYKPLRTIKFMGYAAEEVGLRGSAELAARASARGDNIVTAMQFDMTNYKGSVKPIHLVEDYTNAEQTKFLAKVIDEYLGVQYDYTRCGYACSDHASWHRSGYPTVYAFEAQKGMMNKKIHTSGDTIEVSEGNAEHAALFTKLLLAYVMEVDLQSVDVRL